ncbi:MAG: hypothetical protein R3327_04140 [Nitrosopumilaceae archaeon]|nr:hypothetical protein [Nitrosopumilaceae archaeon]
MTLEEKLLSLKKEFVKSYDGSSHIQEIIPQNSDDSFDIAKNDLDYLHMFAKNNPIYYNSFIQTIDGLPCVVYEGDINQYWLSSIQYGNSKAPFSPTWIMSAHLLVRHAKNLGCTGVVDIGSGDGRIAFCAKSIDMKSHSIEIDEDLVDLQKSICTKLIDFNPACADATKFDYSLLDIENPAFFIGGLAQMGGDVLADAVIKNIKSKDNTLMVLAGTVSPKYTDDTANAGWSKIIQKHNLQVIKTVTLPTVWTFKELHDTPYLFCKFKN